MVKVLLEWWFHFNSEASQTDIHQIMKPILFDEQRRKEPCPLRLKKLDEKRARKDSQFLHDQWTCIV